MASSDLRYQSTSGQIRIQTQTQITRVTHYPRSLARSQWPANQAQVEEEGPLQCPCLCPCQRQPHQPRPQVSRSHVGFNPLELRIYLSLPQLRCYLKANREGSITDQQWACQLLNSCLLRHFLWLFTLTAIMFHTRVTFAQEHYSNSLEIQHCDKKIPKTGI